MPSSIPEYHGEYSIEGRLGESASGSIYRAREVPGGREVAIKVLTPSLDPLLADRLLAEAKLEHGNIVKIAGLFRNKERICIVTEPLEARSLSELIADTRPMSPLDRLEILVQVAEALRHSHAHGISHLDLSPAHVYVLPDGMVKVRDFSLEPGGEASSGIARYKAPEQFSGHVVDAACNVYSFGMIFYELTVDLSGSPANLRKIVQRALRRDRESRYQTFDELLQDVRPVLQQLQSEKDLRLTFLLDDARELLDSGHHLHAIYLLQEAAKLGPVDIAWLEEARRGLEPAVQPVPADVVATDINSAERTGGFDTANVEIPSAASLKKDEIAPAALWDENVQFTVYRPRAVRPREWCTLLVFAHLSERRQDAPADEPDPIKEVRRQAIQTLGKDVDQYQDLRQDSSMPIPQEGELTFVPEINGIEFNPRRISFLWRESVHQAVFRLRASNEVDAKTVRGKMCVYLGSIVVAQIPLKIDVNGASRFEPGEEALEPVTASRYRRIFASYSHQDVSVVEEFERYGRAMGDEYLRDVIHLRSGEVWNDRLFQMIDEASVFQLFWSSNSMQSPYVRKEWQYALSLNRESFVRPVYWEDPLPEARQENLPPEELRRLQFHRVFPGVSAAAASVRKPQTVGRMAYPGGSGYDSAPMAAPAPSVMAAPPIDSSLAPTLQTPAYAPQLSVGSSGGSKGPTESRAFRRGPMLKWGIIAVLSIVAIVAVAAYLKYR